MFSRPTLLALILFLTSCATSSGSPLASDDDQNVDVGTSSSVAAAVEQPDSSSQAPSTSAAPATSGANSDVSPSSSISRASSIEPTQSTAPESDSSSSSSSSSSSTTTTTEPATTTSTTSTTELATTTSTPEISTTQTPTTATVATTLPTTTAPPTTPAPATSGQTIFATRCASCHGPDGSGGRGASLIDIALFTSRAENTVTVTNGGGGMPAFSGRLAAEEIDAVVDYLRVTF